jgi:hypothetical protein
MKQIIIILVSVFFLKSELHSQTDSVYVGNKPPSSNSPKKKRDFAWKDKITYGGNFQAFFGNPTFVYVSPSIGYLITEQFNVGVGMIYNYMRADYGNYGVYSQSIFGGHSYARYNVTPSFFVQGQYDRLRQPDYYSLTAGKKIWVDYAMAGVGYSQGVGENVVFNTSIMYNFTHSVRYSIYPSPFIFQVGIVARVR